MGHWKIKRTEFLEWWSVEYSAMVWRRLEISSRASTQPWNSYIHRKNIGILDIVNVLTPNLEKRFKCPSKSAIYTRNDHNLNKLLDIATLAHEMTNKGGQRIKTLTKDTGNALFQTCHGLRELSIHLLEDKKLRLCPSRLIFFRSHRKSFQQT